MIARNNGNSYAVAGRSKPTPILLDFSRILLRHKKKIFIVFCLTLGVLVAAAAMYPKTYSSESRLFVRLGKESVSLDPTATMNERISVTESRESEINSELEILRSRSLLEDVVSKVGADFVLSRSDVDTNPPAGPMTYLKSWTARLSRPPDARDRAIDSLAHAIDISTPRKSNVIVVNYKAADPQRAQTILQAVVDAYMIRHTKANRTTGSHQFFADQSDLIHDKLMVATSALREAKNRIGVASIEEHRKLVEEHAHELEVALFENQRNVSVAEEKIRVLHNFIDTLPETELAEEALIPSEGVEAMRSELFKLQIQEKEVRSRFSDKHPDAIGLRQQVDEMRNVLAAEQNVMKQPTHKLNVVRQSMQLELATARSQAAAHKAEAVLLAKQNADMQLKIRAMNDEEIRLDELARSKELLEASYRTYATNREQARIDSALAEDNVSNINVLQPASFSSKPSSPNMKLALAAAVLFALSGAILVALGAEHFDHSLKSPEQTETALGVPVLFSIPRGANTQLAKVRS